MKSISFESPYILWMVQHLVKIVAELLKSFISILGTYPHSCSAYLVSVCKLMTVGIISFIKNKLGLPLLWSQLSLEPMDWNPNSAFEYSTLVVWFWYSKLILQRYFFLGNALKCHQCESYTQALCGDPFNDTVTNYWKTEEFFKDCPSDGNTYKFCRKIYQNGKTLALFKQGLLWYGFDGFGRTRQFWEKGSQNRLFLRERVWIM